MLGLLDRDQLLPVVFVYNKNNKIWWLQYFLSLPLKKCFQKAILENLVLNVEDSFRKG